MTTTNPPEDDQICCESCLRRFSPIEMFNSHLCKTCAVAEGVAEPRILITQVATEDVKRRERQVRAENSHNLGVHNPENPQKSSFFKANNRDPKTELPKPPLAAKIRPKKPTKKDFDTQEEAKRELAEREMARRHLLPYVQRKIPGYDAGWIHADICQRLEKFEQDIIAKKSPRLMLFLPPRAGKSELGSKQFPAWFLGRHPELDVVISSYSGDLSQGFSRAVRNSFKDEAHLKVFPGSALAPDSTAADKWHTKEGGAFNAVGVGGSLSGKGGSLLIVDDPHKDRNEAESNTIRNTVKDWYSSVLYTRRAPGAGILVIQTRWHTDDLSGWLLEMQRENENKVKEFEDAGLPIPPDLQHFDKWEVVTYPAIATEDEKYRKKGEAFHPERFPLHELLMVKNALIPRDWQALYQQQPVAEDGEFFTRDMFRYYKPNERPSLLDMRFVAAADLAISQKQTADYSVFTVFGIDRENNYWLVDMRRGRWSGLELIDQMFELQDRWNPDMFGIESGQIELTLEPFIAKAEQERGINLKYQKLKTRGQDKQTRAFPLQGRMQQGRVYYPHPESVEWMYTLVTELLQFPLGKNDDIVDSLAWNMQMILQQGIANRKAPVKKKEGWRQKYKHLLKTSGGSKSAMSS